MIGAAILMKKLLRSMEFFCGMAVFESLWVRIRREDFEGDAMVGTCCRPPDEGEEMGKAFFKQLEEVSGLQTLVHMVSTGSTVLWDTNREVSSSEVLGKT